MDPYRGIDLLDIESQLTGDERQVRDTIRGFVDREAMAFVVPHFREGTFPMELVSRMGELGIFGAHIDGYGCAGLGSVAYGLIMQELERADSGFRSFASVQSSLAMTAIHLFGYSTGHNLAGRHRVTLAAGSPDLLLCLFREMAVLEIVIRQKSQHPGRRGTAAAPFPDDLGDIFKL